MVVRIFFVRYIGREYLGLNGVYTSLLSMMSIADLGLDTVFVFLLYKPLKDNASKVINGILLVYRDVYRVIAGLIMAVGLVLTPFLPDIIGHSKGLTGIYIIYFLYIANAVVGYLNAYNRSLLIADQNGYIVNGITSGIIVLVDLVQIFQVSIYPSPIFYMVIQVVGTILTNTIITIVVKQKYRNTLKAGIERLTKREKTTLIKNGIGGVSNKIGSIVVISSDNILLSIFTNLITVGMYSNYTVLTQACSKIMQLISSAITPSVGELGVEGNREKNKEIFLELSFIIYTLSTFVFSFFWGFVSPFVSIWLGKSNVFPLFLTWLISVNLWLTLIRTPSWMFADSFGLQWVQKWKSVVEAIVNLVLSVLFLKVFKMGIEGIIMGTIISTIVVVIWYEPWTVFRHVIPNVNLRSYFLRNVPFVIIICISSVAYFLILRVGISQSTIINEIVSAVLQFIITLISFIAFFRHDTYYKRALHRLEAMSRKLLKIID